MRRLAPLELEPSLTDGRRPALVLVVDDSPACLAHHERCLASNGFDVVTCNDSFAALSVLYSRRPDAVVVEARMERLDGYDLCALLTRSKDFRHVPVIVATASDALADKALAYMLGASAFLLKPLDPDTLATHVRRGIANRLG